MLSRPYEFGVCRRPFTKSFTYRSSATALTNRESDKRIHGIDCTSSFRKLISIIIEGTNNIISKIGYVIVTTKDVKSPSARNRDEGNKLSAM